MTFEMWLTLGILLIAIVLFITEWLRVDVVALGVMVALMVTGLLSTGEALAGFSSSVVITIAALFIIGGAVFNTGLAAMIGNRILGAAGTNETRLMVVVMLAAVLMSGFMSDTGVVAVMLPAIVSLAASAKIPPSKLLIPLAYGSLLGGATTLIGTPPNIVVSDLLRDTSYPSFEFFSFTPVGLVLVVGGILFMIFAGKYFLPKHKHEQVIQEVETPSELFDRYRLHDNLFKLRVRSESPLIGQTLEMARLGRDYSINILEIARSGKPRTVARLGEQRLVLQSNQGEVMHPSKEISLDHNDMLIVSGDGSKVAQAAAKWNLAIQPGSKDDESTIITEEVGIAEILVPSRSSVIGDTLVDMRFGSTHHLTVLDIRRPDTNELLDLKTTPLRFGDILLVQGEWRNISALNRKRRDFVVLGADTNGIHNRRKAPMTLILVIFMLILMVTNAMPVAAITMLTALLMILTGCLTMDDAYNAIDWKSIVLIAGMLPMSTALEKYGLVNLIADGFVETLGTMGPHAVLFGLFLLTSLFTQVLSNTATAVLAAPIALAAATSLGIQPQAFLMGVAIAASMAFASPVASPVNTLVMGAGNYRFSDYVKIGIPMIILMLVLSLIALPIMWPF
ncbi:SLC13 family permease [Phototrophicus methaneseepsis]|uniref:SLC13 family permease n=1 Tax=Phototrophicus methaneseepsis TaxID=2710758 RepID=A0A7S8E9S7_9CHLR|nr:SLC13 family permease [Phototrophicus methaneseepsis]QPC82967.1 SLC13 family permease [Phototrophicus methaneseepsis]